MGTVKTIRVCHLASGDLWAGAEVQLATLIAGLTKFHDLRLSVILLNSGVLAERLRELDIPVTILDERSHNAAQLLLRIRRILANERFDILHTHRYKENILGGLARIMTGVPHQIRTVHGLAEPSTGFKGVKSRVYRLFDAIVTRTRIDMSIAVSCDIERQLSAQFGPERVIMIHNGIDGERLQPTASPADIRKRLGLSADHKLIGSVGRLTPVKGYQYLLGAFRTIAANHPDARLVLVGDGPERAALESLTAEYGLDKKVVFYGFTPDVGDILAALDVFVLSSLHEGISISLLESLALGIPSVVTNVGGNPEVIRHNDTGLLVPPMDESALASAVGSILDNPGRTTMMREAGRILVASEFSKAAMATRVHTLYRRLADFSGA
ncbi:MAG: glycosyltransferase [candidate division Zixibacteria bacterium]|nr:glycosyltransferase [candidate division Zixibacteria bacterium]